MILKKAVVTYCRCYIDTVLKVLRKTTKTQRLDLLPSRNSHTSHKNEYRALLISNTVWCAVALCLTERRLVSPSDVLCSYVCVVCLKARHSVDTAESSDAKFMLTFD